MFILDNDFGELKSIEINKFEKEKKYEDINSCVYALIQWTTYTVGAAISTAWNMDSLLYWCYPVAYTLNII